MGWRAPITVSNRSGFITRGHGRLEAATLLGCEQVPVDFQDYASEQAELADMLADNHLAELAEIDEDRLVGVLKELQAAGHDVGLAGFTEDEVVRLTAVDEEIAQLEPIPKMELQAAATARRGHAFWDHSATLGIRTCCGWSFGHSRGPVVVPRCAQSPPIAEVGTLLLAGGFGLQDTLEIVSGDGVVGIEPQGGSQVGCRGLQVSLIHVHEAQITLGQVAVRIEALNGLEFRLGLRVLLLI